jgi:hypothetical protein
MRPNLKTHIQKMSPLFRGYTWFIKIIDQLFLSTDQVSLTFQEIHDL